MGLIFRTAMKIAVEKTMPILKIVSGGQTGADQAALDWAIANGFSHGGWCPAGRRSENGKIQEIYRLEETPETKYQVRTAQNVLDSDATVIFSIEPRLSGGSLLTRKIAEQEGKPVLHLSRRTRGGESETSNTAEKLLDFIENNQVAVLNVAGPRLSSEPDIEDFVKEMLDGLKKIRKQRRTNSRDEQSNQGQQEGE